MKRKLIEEDNAGYSEHELDKMMENLELNHFQIQRPDKHEIDICIEALYEYIPKPITFIERLKFIINEVKLELSYFTRFELKSVIILLILFAGMLTVSTNKLELMFSNLAVIPVIMGFISLNKSKYTNMLELELSLKRSWKNRMFSKLIIYYGFSIILLSLLSLWSVITGANIDILRYISMSLFTIGSLSMVSLWVLVHLRGLSGTIVTICIWLVFSGAPLVSGRYYNILEQVSTLNYFAASIVSTGLFIYLALRIIRKKHIISQQLCN